MGSLFPVVALISIADVAGGLGISADDAALVGTVHNLGSIAGVLATPLSFFGVGRGRTLAVMSTGFVVSSALCAIVADLDAMLVARALQGFFDAAMPLMFMLLVMTSLKPGAGRFEGITMVGTSTSLFFGAAALIGGLLVDHLGWQALFWAQALLGLPYCFATHFLLRHEKGRPELLADFDWSSYLLLVLGLSMLLFAVSEGERHFWLEAWWVPALSLGGLILVVSSYVGLIQHGRPLLFLQVFRRPTFTWGIVLSLFFGFGQMFALYTVPSYLGRLQGYRPLDTGSILLFMIPAAASALGLSYWWSRRHDGRWLLSAGLASFAVAAGLCMGLDPTWAAEQLRWGALAAGAGMGFFSIAILRFVVHDATPQDGPTVGMILNLTRIFSLGIGTAIVSHIVVEREKLHSARLVEAVSTTSPETMRRLGQFSGNLARLTTDPQAAHAAAVAALGKTTSNQAFTLAFGDAFLVTTIVLALGAILVWALPAVPADKPAPDPRAPRTNP
ncbi:hypothetical protein L284_09635 [Novosphingobium lindaniclasticum LE124]|uniref:Major facilitator superfamily (MFS) profile domain-containing protein n=1 Tax=Novosphingobium lindaniclasticum LE124 TaxID=1096930 RepID=T0HW55_9SPHN|nr:hypothetical protein L284_09635 [Novosphingobium lindaniclasticum LE124]